MTRCPACGDVTMRLPHTRSDATECSGLFIDPDEVAGPLPTWILAESEAAAGRALGLLPAMDGVEWPAEPDPLWMPPHPLQPLADASLPEWEAMAGLSSVVSTSTPTPVPGQSVEEVPGIELVIDPRMPPDTIALVSETDAVVVTVTTPHP